MPPLFHGGDLIGVGFASLCVLLAGFWPWPYRPAATVLLTIVSFALGLYLAVTWS